MHAVSLASNTQPELLAEFAGALCEVDVLNTLSYVTSYDSDYFNDQLHEIMRTVMLIVAPPSPAKLPIPPLEEPSPAKAAAVPVEEAPPAASATQAAAPAEAVPEVEPAGALHTC